MKDNDYNACTYWLCCVVSKKYNVCVDRAQSIMHVILAFISICELHIDMFVHIDPLQ